MKKRLFWLKRFRSSRGSPGARCRVPGAPGPDFGTWETTNPNPPESAPSHPPTHAEYTPFKNPFSQPEHFCKCRQMNNLQTYPIDSMVLRTGRFWPMFCPLQAKKAPFSRKIQDFSTGGLARTSPRPSPPLHIITTIRRTLSVRRVQNDQNTRGGIHLGRIYPNPAAPWRAGSLLGKSRDHHPA